LFLFEEKGDGTNMGVSLGGLKGSHLVSDALL
jgi:hypothetical protein